jgi:predicted dehydrogenase
MNRRYFIKATAAAGITAAAIKGGDRLFASTTLGANNRVVLALIGCGGRGLSCVINCCKTNANVEVKTVCDVNRTKMTKAAAAVEKELGYRPATTGDMRTVFDDHDVTAVWIATPEHWHCPASMAACEAGKDVYVEKNLSVNIHESRLLVASAAKHKRVVQMGFQNRSASQGVSARTYIAEGKLGAIVTVKTYFMLGGSKWTQLPDAPVPEWLDWKGWLGPTPYRPFNPSIVDEHGRGGWQRYWAYSGGLLDDEASHTIDFARMVLGDPPHPTSIYGWGGNKAFGSESETYEFQSITYDFGNYVMTADGGPSLNYMAKAPWDIRNDRTRFPNWRNYSARVEIYGTKGLMYLGRHGGGWQVIGMDDKIVAEDGAVFPDNAHQKNFIDCIRSRQTPNGDIEQGHRSSTLVNLGNIACRTGNTLLRFDPSTEKITNNSKANKLAQGK